MTSDGPDNEPLEVQDWQPEREAAPRPDELLERALELTIVHARLSPAVAPLPDLVHTLSAALKAWRAFWSCCEDPEAIISGAAERRAACAARAVLACDADPVGAIASGRLTERYGALRALRYTAREIAGL